MRLHLSVDFQSCFFFSILATAYDVLRLSVEKQSEMGGKGITHSVILVHSLHLADTKKDFCSVSLKQNKQTNKKTQEERGIYTMCDLPIQILQSVEDWATSLRFVAYHATEDCSSLWTAGCPQVSLFYCFFSELFNFLKNLGLT